ncbi:GDSL esterase/lipase At5g45920 isoform X2 [Cynara cardunculus var. scolymus]|uniref:GDSL esterase/lipase At5g45920 isoform X2 n=1 Tax=Cynara cardunculus var. scolymus TaxID=59895 RepID=UPI000D62EF24|nr:GDSL esterase/lipase At5g45920 isoform X2 [Cynara cardunculus var. scolymus]
MRPKIYLFGDSITEESFSDGGWGASLANHFARTADVVLRGYSGYNTRWAMKVMEKVFPAEMNVGGGRSPLAVTVFYGANDACLPDRSSAFQHVPIDEYKQNLHAIVSHLKKRWPSTHVILITPPPIDEVARLLHSFDENPSNLPERTNEAAGNYAKACVAVAGECRVPVVDLWTRMQQFPYWGKTYLRDGLHLTLGGNKIVFEEVIGKLHEVGLSLETLPADLPFINTIDHMNPLNAFKE